MTVCRMTPTGVVQRTPLDKAQDQSSRTTYRRTMLADDHLAGDRLNLPFVTAALPIVPNRCSNSINDRRKTPGKQTLNERFDSGLAKPCTRPLDPVIGGLTPMQCIAKHDFNRLLWEKRDQRPFWCLLIEAAGSFELFCHPREVARRICARSSISRLRMIRFLERHGRKCGSRCDSAYVTPIGNTTRIPITRAIS